MKSISSGALAAFALGIALFAGAPAHADEAESYESLSNETISLLLQPSSTKHQGPERVPLTDAGAEHVTDNPVLDVAGANSAAPFAPATSRRSAACSKTVSRPT